MRLGSKLTPPRGSFVLHKLIQGVPLKIFLSVTIRPTAFIFGVWHHLGVLYQYCSNYAPGVKISPAPGTSILHMIIYDKLFKFFLSRTVRPRTFIFGLYLYLVSLYQRCSKYALGVKTGPTLRGGGVISFTQTYIGITLKNLLVCNHTAQSFHIWYVVSSRGSRPILFKLCPWGQNWPGPQGLQLYMGLYRKKTLKIFFFFISYFVFKDVERLLSGLYLYCMKPYMLYKFRKIHLLNSIP